MQRMSERSFRPSAEEGGEEKVEEAKEEDELKYASVRKTVWLLYFFGFMVSEGQWRLSVCFGWLPKRPWCACVLN